MEGFDPSVTVLALLVLAALISGYMDTLVGGGGLITIPALMAAGLPPIYALGTNKLQAVAGSGTASAAMLLSGRVKLAEVKWWMLAAFIGSLLGAGLVQTFDSRVLTAVIPLVLLLIAIYFLISPAQPAKPQPAKLSKTRYGVSAVPIVGMYDGMFGPGTGSFFVWAGVALRGQPIVYSTMVAKTLNFATNLAALMVFISFGKVAWLVGFSMMVGQALGASLGARSLMTVRPEVLRYLVIVVCLVILGFWWLS